MPGYTARSAAGSGAGSRSCTLSRFPTGTQRSRPGSEVLRTTGRGAAYAFTVAPSLATRYFVELFRGGRTTPAARSRTVTIYMTRDLTAGALICHRPLCRAAITLHVVVPAGAMDTEISKHWYTYGAPGPASAAMDLELLEPGNPDLSQLPKTFSPQVSKPRRISATEFELTIRFPPGYRQEMSSWHFTACAADTETRDGLGLPGRHQCGLRSVSSASYLG